MKYLKELQTERLFTLSDVSRLTGNKNTAASLLAGYKRKGYVTGVRKDLYAALDLASGNPIASRYEIASRLTETSFVSHHTAMEFYGISNQVFHTVTVSAKEKIRPFSFDGVPYQPVRTDLADGVITPAYQPAVRVTSLARTVVDCIDEMGLAGGLEELLRCIALIPELDGEEVLRCLRAYGRKNLWQRTGFLLSLYKQELRLPDRFFEECRKNIGERKNYLNEGNDLVYYPEWRLYAPGDLEEITQEGEDILV